MTRDNLPTLDASVLVKKALSVGRQRPPLNGFTYMVETAKRRNCGSSKANPGSEAGGSK